MGQCSVIKASEIQGLNQAPTFLGSSPEQREDILIMNTEAGAGPGCDWRGIRTKEWMYSNNGDGDWLLYYLPTDPYQMKSLIKNSEFEHQRERLRARVEDLRAEVGETIPLRTNRQVRDKIAPAYPVKDAIISEEYLGRWSNT